MSEDNNDKDSCHISFSKGFHDFGKMLKMCLSYIHFPCGKKGNFSNFQKYIVRHFE